MPLQYFPKLIARILTRVLLLLPVWMLRLIAGRAITIDHQEMDLHCQIMAKNSPFKGRFLNDLARVRREYEASGDLLAHDGLEDIVVSQFSAATETGAINAECYRCETLTGKRLPAVIYYHGGGHVIGSLNTHREACKQIAKDTQCAVFAVDYRLAPEYQFPAGINDCLAFYDYLTLQGNTLNIDVNRIVLAGDSAGGNIAAVVAQQRKKHQIAPFLQILIVPWLDMSKQSESYDLFASGCYLSREFMEWYRDLYLADSQDGLSPKASPLLGDVNGVCPAAVYVAGFDPLRDEGAAYAKSLTASGVDVVYKKFDTLIHPFMNFAGQVPAAGEAFREITKFIRERVYA